MCQTSEAPYLSTNSIPEGQKNTTLPIHNKEIPDQLTTPNVLPKNPSTSTPKVNPLKSNLDPLKPKTLKPTIPNKIDKRVIPPIPCDPKNTNYPKTEREIKKHSGWEVKDYKYEEGTTYQRNKANDYVRFDKGDPTKPRHGKKDHHHRYYLNQKGDEIYLDKNGNATNKGSGPYHIYKRNN